jgi:ankyrin repeat protein
VLPKGYWTPVMYAARQGASQAATALADAGADLDARDPDGTTALIIAIINGHHDVARVLVEKGADPNVADGTGMTPLYAAVDMHTLASTFGRPDPLPWVTAGSVGAIRMLLAAGADPNMRLSTRVLKRVHNAGDGRLAEGATAFMRAARGGDAIVMRILLESGADPALPQTNGNTPLLLAASVAADRGGDNPQRGGDIDALAALEICLAQGLDINAVNTAGDTALHSALGSPRIIRFLAERGARLDAKDKRGRTPLEAALNAREPHVETIALLKQLTGAAAGQAAAR